MEIIKKAFLEANRERPAPRRKAAAGRAGLSDYSRAKSPPKRGLLVLPKGN